MGQSYSTNIGLSPFPEIDQTRYPSIFNDALRVRQAIAVLQGALDFYTGTVGADSETWSHISPLSYDKLANLTRTYLKATEDIVAGNTINFYNNSGVLAARKANASTGKPAHAFAIAPVTTNTWGEFIRMGSCKFISAMTPGTTYYQSNTDGVVSSNPGTVSQKLGYAISANELFFIPDLI